MADMGLVTPEEVRSLLREYEYEHCNGFWEKNGHIITESFIDQQPAFTKDLIYTLEKHP